MLPFTDSGVGETSLVLMPFLGGSQREWIESVSLLNKSNRCITVDLPGFGAAGSITGYSVEEMADQLIELLSSLHLGRYVLIGHSMAGKVSAVATRKLIAHGKTPGPPVGLVLVAPSPPGPEPMSDSKREEMLHSLGEGRQAPQAKYSESDRPAAEQFLRDNLANPISGTPFQRTVDDLLKMNPAAWNAWLKSGSKEDWKAFVGVIDLPTLVAAGKADEALGPEAQRVHTLPHFSQPQMAIFDCSHLVPLEKPEDLASLVSNFVQQIESNSHAIPVDHRYLNLINSRRVSPQTRDVLLARTGAADQDYVPSALTPYSFLTLRSVVTRVIPQNQPEIDLASGLDKLLAEKKGDGWRYASLPSDLDSYHVGLALLDDFATKLSAVPFTRLSLAAQDGILDAMASGRLHSPKLDLKRWFEDLRASATQLYVSHPQTLARMGYSGIADDSNGFVQIGIGEREEWEPEAL